MFYVSTFFQYGIESSFRSAGDDKQVGTLVEVKREWERFVAHSNAQQAQGAHVRKIRMFVTHSDNDKGLVIDLECEYEDGDQLGWFLDSNKVSRWV